jgi:hypothetical protein
VASFNTISCSPYQKDLSICEGTFGAKWAVYRISRAGIALLEHHGHFTTVLHSNTEHLRLRYVFATPSDRLRDRSGKALGLSKLRSDSPLDSVHVGRSYLDPIQALNGSSTLGSLGVSYVVLANGVLGVLFDTDSSAQALVLDRIVHCRERWDNQLDGDDYQTFRDQIAAD